MKLTLKEFGSIGRSMYLFTPEGELRTPYENTYLTILRESGDEDSVRAIMALEGFEELCNEQRIIVGFPNPLEGGWNAALDPSKHDDLSDLYQMQDEYSTLAGMVDYSKMHPMHYAKYFAGVGSGATMLNSLVAINPTNIAGILTVGGVMCEEALKKAIPAVTPALLINSDKAAETYYVNSCNAAPEKNESGCRVYRNAINPVQFVIAEDRSDCTLTGELLQKAWNELFSVVRRPNTSLYGDIEPRLMKKDYNFAIHENECILGDNNGMPHTWFEYIPSCVRENPPKKVPLMVFGHGGSDNPAEAAQMSRMHDVGEKYGFIVAYPWSSTQWGWNIDMLADQPNDVDYIYALIKYLVGKYPIDETRVYTSGFSNGSAMMQVFSMVHPEIVAAICPNNTRWCQQREVRPFELAYLKKAQYDYRMPVWYTYGGRDLESPVVRGSGQQTQYDFWKHYNNIAFKPTPYGDNPDPSGVGVPGDVIEEFSPCARHPQHKYTVHRFFTQDAEPKNYYNYVLMHGKGHDCAPADAELGWKFVSQFCRNPDGSTGSIG